MRLGPAVALLYMNLVADVSTASDLWRTHPCSIQAARKPFAIEDRSHQLTTYVPDPRTNTIEHPPIGGILWCPCSQVDTLASFEFQRDMRVFVQVSLALFDQCQGTHPRRFSCPFQPWDGFPIFVMQGLQVHWGGTEHCQRLITSEIGEQLMGNQIGCVKHRSCQCLLQIGHCG